MWIRGVRLSPARPDRRPQRALRTTRQFAVRRFAIDEKATVHAQIVRGAGPVGPLFLTDDEEHSYALLAAADEAIRRYHHRGGESLRVGGAAPEETSPFQPRRDEWGDGVEMSRECDAAFPPGFRGPDVRASARHFLKGHVPTARHQPARHVVDDSPLGSSRRFYGHELGGERHDIGHARKLARREGDVRTMRGGIPAPPAMRVASGRRVEACERRLPPDTVDVVDALDALDEHVLGKTVRFLYVSIVVALANVSDLLKSPVPHHPACFAKSLEGVLGLAGHHDVADEADVIALARRVSEVGYHGRRHSDLSVCHP